MVIVANAIFVKRGRACGLDATDDPPFRQKRQGVINSLTRDRADLAADGFCDSICGAVGVR
jgi:hypothetical protein